MTQINSDEVEIIKKETNPLCRMIEGHLYYPEVAVDKMLLMMYQRGQREAKVVPEAPRKWAIGVRVRKSRGSWWQGKIVGFYSTALTPIGYAVESEREIGSVQIYPESALEEVRGSHLIGMADVGNGV